MRIKIKNPRKLVNYAFTSNWDWDMAYNGETDSEYLYEIQKVHNLKSISVELWIHKAVEEKHDFVLNKRKFVELTYISSKGKKVSNWIKLEGIKDPHVLLESIKTTMQVFE